MKTIKLFTVIYFFIVNVLSAQIKTITMKVINITELDDNVYEIRALNEQGDTIRIFSIKEKIHNIELYEEIKINKKYNFSMIPDPSPIINLTIKIGNKIYWRTGDEEKEMPHFAINIIGKYIKKE